MGVKYRLSLTLMLRLTGERVEVDIQFQLEVGAGWSEVESRSALMVPLSFPEYFQKGNPKYHPLAELPADRKSVV